MMKKLLVALLVGVMSFSFVACGGKDSQQGTEQTDKNNNNKFERETTEEGYVVISKKEFASYITKVELTTENWKEYLEIVELKEEERNGFGEVVNSETSIECTAKNVIGCYFDDVAIDFNVIETGEKVYCEGQFHRVITPNDYNDSWEGYTVDDFACEKIVGTLLMFKGVPDECLASYEDGGKFICVGSAEDYMKIDMNNSKDLSMDISLAYVIYN